MKSFFLAFFLIGFLMVGCTRFVADPDACYNNKVKAILVSNCANAGCHNPNDKQNGYDFTEYEGVMKAVKAGHSGQSELYTAIKNNEMPVGYALSKEDKAIIKQWINNGALNNSCEIAICDTTQASFNQVESVIAANCIGCHRETNPQGDVRLDTYENIVRATANNKLLGSIKHETGFSPMPKYAGKLSTCDISTIEHWIKAGVPK